LEGRLRATVLALGLALSLLPCVAPAAADAREQRVRLALARVVEGYWQEHLQLRPLHATLIGDHRFDGELPDSLADAQISREYAVEKRALAALARIDVNALPARDRLDYEAFRWERATEIEGFRYPAELLPITPTGGMLSLMPQFGAGGSAQPFATVVDYENWLRRLDAYVVWLDRSVANLRRGLSRGYVMPRVAVARTLPQLAAIVDAPIAQSLFLRPVQAFPAGMPMADQVRLRGQFATLIGDRLYPAYRRLYDFLRNDYLPRARATIGWSDLPQGKAWYAHRVRRATTTTLEPSEIHHLALEEVRRLGADVDRLAADLGLKADRRAALEALRADPRGYFEHEEDLVAGYAALKLRVRQRLGEFIDVLPRADFEVRALDPARAPGAGPLLFRAGAADGSRAGVLYVNTSDLRLRPKYDMDAAYLREAEPGRGLEYALLQETRGLLNFRRYGGYVAFADGWGLYAESQGRDLGLYAEGTSLYASLAQQLLRAARAVVDTGVHVEGWSRERATDYLVANTPLNAVEAGGEVDRVIGNPAQSLPAVVGALRLRALRARALQALGPRFDVRAFHHALLANGPLPLDVVDAEVTRWLKAQGAAP
jgi:uncharacterized protein (DUF885 family)